MGLRLLDSMMMAVDTFMATRHPWKILDGFDRSDDVELTLADVVADPRSTILDPPLILRAKPREKDPRTVLSARAGSHRTEPPYDVTRIPPDVVRQGPLESPGQGTLKGAVGRIGRYVERLSRHFDCAHRDVLAVLIEIARNGGVVSWDDRHGAASVGVRDLTRALHALR